MFLNIQKIGKTKHKYKARLTFIKVTNESTEKGIRFKIKFERGSHEVESISDESRKGVGKFKEEEKIIPLTLFCKDDEQELAYLEKDAFIKIYECDDNGNDIRKIGSKEIDIAEFATKGKIKLDIQLDPVKKTDSPVLKVELYLERQDDDSKSVKTYSSNNDKRTDRDEESENYEKVKDRNGKSNDLNSNQNQNDDQQNIVKKTREKNTDESKNDPKPNNFNNGTKREKNFVDQNKQEDEKSEETASEKNKSLFSKNSKKSQNSFSEKLDDPKFKDGAKNSKEKSNNSSFQPMISEDPSEHDEATDSKTKNLHTEFTQGESPELQAFLLKKALKEKEAEVLMFKRQNDALKKTVDKLVDDAASTKEIEKRAGFEKESEELKKTIVNKNIKIDELSTTNKILTERQEEYEKTIMKLRQELTSTKEKVSDIKYKQAFFMQELFESSNKEALEEACRFFSI